MARHSRSLTSCGESIHLSPLFLGHVHTLHALKGASCGPSYGPCLCSHYSLYTFHTLLRPNSCQTSWPTQVPSHLWGHSCPGQSLTSSPEFPKLFFEPLWGRVHIFLMTSWNAHTSPLSSWSALFLRWRLADSWPQSFRAGESIHTFWTHLLHRLVLRA